MTPLHRLALSIAVGQRFDQKIKEEDNRRVERILKGCQEQQLLQTGEFLIQVIKYLKRPEAAQEKTLQDLNLEKIAIEIQTELPQLLKKLKDLSLAHIRELSMIIVEKYEEKEYLFSGGHAQADEPLPKQVKEHLKDLENKLIHKKASVFETNNWIRIFEGLLKLLSDVKCKNMIEIALSKSQKQLKTVIAAEIEKLVLTIGEESIQAIEIALPQEVEAAHYTSYMRNIHRLCGALMIQAQRLASKTSRKVYVEKIPDELDRSTQFIMKGTEIVPPPPSIQDELVQEKEIIEEEAEISISFDQLEIDLNDTQEEEIYPQKDIDLSIIQEDSEKDKEEEEEVKQPEMNAEKVEEKPLEKEEMNPEKIEIEPELVDFVFINKKESIVFSSLSNFSVQDVLSAAQEVCLNNSFSYICQVLEEKDESLESTCIAYIEENKWKILRNTNQAISTLTYHMLPSVVGMFFT